MKKKKGAEEHKITQIPKRPFLYENESSFPEISDVQELIEKEKTK